MTGSFSFHRHLLSSGLIITLLTAFTSCQPGLQPWERFPFESGEQDLTTLESVDLNGDKINELLAGGVSSEGLLIFRRDPAGDRTNWFKSVHDVGGGVVSVQFWNPLIGDSRQPFLIVLNAPPRSEAKLFPINTSETTNITLDDPIPIPLPAANWREVASADFNNDGLEDLAFAAGVENEDLAGAPVALWLSQPATPDREPERQTLVVGQVGKALLLEVEDIDNDGDMDLKLVDGNNANESMGAYWLENPWPDEPGVEWKRRFITLSAAPPARGQITDLDGDSEADLLVPFQIAEGSNRLIGFKKIVKGGQTGWLPLPYPLSGKQGKLSHVAGADLNMDGSSDVVLGFSESPAPLEHLHWMENPGDSPTPKWIRRPIAGASGSQIRDMIIWDVDQDGDPDVMVIENAGQLVWYQNPHFPLQD